MHPCPVAGHPRHPRSDPPACPPTAPGRPLVPPLPPRPSRGDGHPRGEGARVVQEQGWGGLQAALARPALATCTNEARKTSRVRGPCLPGAEARGGGLGRGCVCKSHGPKPIKTPRDPRARRSRHQPQLGKLWHYHDRFQPGSAQRCGTGKRSQVFLGGVGQRGSCCGSAASGMRGGMANTTLSPPGSPVPPQVQPVLPGPQRGWGHGEGQTEHRGTSKQEGIL